VEDPSDQFPLWVWSTVTEGSRTEHMFVRKKSYKQYSSLRVENRCGKMAAVIERRSNIAFRSCNRERIDRIRDRIFEMVRKSKKSVCTMPKQSWGPFAAMEDGDKCCGYVIHSECAGSFCGEERKLSQCLAQMSISRRRYSITTVLALTYREHSYLLSRNYNVENMGACLSSLGLDGTAELGRRRPLLLPGE
jgi:hypothetical protein